MVGRERVLIVTRNLPPLRGGMERLNARMAEELSKEFDVEVVGPAGSDVLAHAGLVVHAAPSPRLLAFLAWATWKSFVIARARRPSWVIGGSGLVAPIVRLAAAISGGFSAVYLHGLDIVVDHPVYQALWLPAIRGMALCLSNSRNTTALAVARGVAAGAIETVFPGVDTRKVSPSGLFRERHQLGAAKLMLSVGRLTRRKGLDRFVERCLPSIVSREPDAVLVVIGDDAPDALAAGPAGMRGRLVQSIERLGLVDRVRFLGPVAEDDLLDAYASCDVHVFPVREVPGDIEGFGMVAIEAAAQGLSTVAFAVGGVSDAVAEGRSGHLVPSDEDDAFADAVVTRLREGRASLADSAMDFAASFAWERFGDRIVSALATHRRPQ
jgi:phosphatidylinositol alpha-1,6-mannosyltransferase